MVIIVPIITGPKKKKIELKGQEAHYIKKCFFFLVMYHQNIIAKEVFSEKKHQETKRRLKIEDQRRKTQDNQDLKNQEFF